MSRSNNGVNGHRSFWHGHVQHGADLQAGNGDRGSASENGPSDRHHQATRASHAQVGQHGRRHRKGATGCTV